MQIFENWIMQGHLVTTMKIGAKYLQMLVVLSHEIYKNLQEFTRITRIELDLSKTIFSQKTETVTLYYYIERFHRKRKKKNVRADFFIQQLLWPH